MGAPAYAHPAMLASERPVRLAAFGELLWDVYPKARLLGGAPANVAFHARALGAQSTLVSRVGNDALGREARAELERRGVDVSQVGTDQEHATGTVTVTLTSAGPQFVIEPHAAWDFISVDAAAHARLTCVDAFCFGSLAQRHQVARTALFQILDGFTEARPLLVFDVNLRPPFVDLGLVLRSIERADVVKLNEDELAWLAHALDVPDAVDWLLAQRPHQLIAVTRGARGAALCTGSGNVEHPGFASSGIDPVGAGDAFTATLAVEILNGSALDVALESACRRSAWVAGKSGAMPAPD